jgi:hypothetical protein
MKFRGLLVVGSVAVVMAGAPAGCDASDAPKVATAQSRAATAPSPAASAALANESDYDKALRYTRCMTENGQKIPDPVVGQPLPIAAPGKGWTTTDTPAFKKCRHFLPAIWPVKTDPNQIAQARPWGECMRKHGVDVPELHPDANGMLPYAPDPATDHTPQWIAADNACRDPGTIPLSDG